FLPLRSDRRAEADDGAGDALGGAIGTGVPAISGRRSRSHIASDRQKPFIEQVGHFGLRALRCVGPKSISAWLKSNTCLCGSTAADTVQRGFFIAWVFGSPLPTKILKSTRATFVSRMAARSRNAKLRMAPAVYSPMPWNDSSVSRSLGSRPSYFSTACCAIDCSRFGRML